jgi:hypothetical protein
MKTMVAGRRMVTLLAVLAAVSALLWVTAPAFHWLWFGWFWRHPTGCVLILAALALLFRARPRNWKKPGCTFWIVGALLPVGLIFYVNLAGGLARWYLVRDLQPQQLDALPETAGVRYLPMEVAERYARNKMQDSVYQVGDIDPLDADGQVDWVAPRVPNGLWNSFMIKSDGFVVVRPDGQVETIHQSMKYGEGMRITSNITWPLWRMHYTADLSEFYYVQVGKEVMALAPYVYYRYVFPVQVPYWGGVFVVHSNGQIEDLSPQQAIADPRFITQRLYPEALARAVGDAWGYRKGVPNAWFAHEDQTQLPSATDTGNQMPYLLPTAAGPRWFLGLEPYGPSWSIFKMLFIDARTGVIELQELPKEAGLIGPSSALGYVRSAFPTYNWYKRGEKESSGDVIAIEPRPVIKDGVLYWQFSVTNTAYAGVRRTAFVNAGTNEVIYFENLSEIRQFLSGSLQGQGAKAGEPATSGSTDLSKLSDSELIRLLRQLTDELERRRK